MESFKTSWDLSALFKSDNDPEIIKSRKEVLRKSKIFINKWKDREDYLKNPKVLKNALDEYAEWFKNYAYNAREWYYFNLRHSQNLNDPKINASLNKALELGRDIQNETQFFELRLSKVNSKTQKAFVNNKALQPYKHFLERIFVHSPYLLSEPEEKIMNLKSAPAHENWLRLTQSLLSKEERSVFVKKKKKEKRPFTDLFGLINSKEKQVRDSAAKALNSILISSIDIAENEINSVLQNKKINDKLRGYARPDKARHIGDDIDTVVVDTLVKSVSNRFNIAKKYYKLKAKLFNVGKLKYHERNVEYGKFDTKYSYKESVKLLGQVFKKLDKEFFNIFEDFVNEGRIDVYPAKGKRGGAFAAYNLLTQPSYLLLNHTNLLDDVRTFAHEMGHGINYELIRKKQNSLNFGTPISTAEVASTFMENFVIQKLIKDADSEFKLSLMMSKLNQDISSVFRQIAFYNFETELHNKFRKTGYLSKEEIGSMFQKHMESYMGPAVEQSLGSENWWSYVWHFRSFFYVYSYASGLLISKSLQASVKKDAMFIKNVKEFLSAGLSDSPKNIFAKLGIDITDKSFWNSGLGEVEHLLNETEKLAENIGKT